LHGQKQLAAHCFSRQRYNNNRRKGQCCKALDNQNTLTAANIDNRQRARFGKPTSRPVRFF